MVSLAKPDPFDKIAGWPGLRHWFGCFFASIALACPVQPHAQTFTSPGAWSFTVPAGVSTIQVRIAGGGGGGGGADVSRGGNGANGALIVAAIAVSPGQTISGTIGAGGASGYTAGETYFGYGPQCTGGGAGGSGAGSGGTGANVDCTGFGYSGGGGGGGGGTTLAINGTVALQAGGGGGGAGGGNGSIGGNGVTSITFTQLSNCGTNGVGGAPGNYANDGGGGGGGGGGVTGGAAGSSNPDGTPATGGVGGASCYSSSATFLSRTIAASGGAGAAGALSQSGSAAVGGGNGYVEIALAGVTVAKTSSLVTDPVTPANPHLVPGATVLYCITVTNTGFVDSTGIVITDPLPSTTTYVANSMKSGTSCATSTTSPAAGATLSGTTITVNTGTLTPAASYAIIYQATVK